MIVKDAVGVLDRPRVGRRLEMISMLSNLAFQCQGND